jgi:protein-S-isoprenylcysteine O-methyltransferase Ste14
MPAPNIIDTVRALFSDFTLLVKQEFDLARAEMSEKFEQIQVGVAAIAAGLLIAFVALLVLVQALVVALSNIMPPSIASLLVGIILAVVAFVSVTMGRQSLAARNLTPQRTLNSFRDSAETIKETV